MRTTGTDAVGVLRWGLRRYRFLFLVCVLLGAVLAPLWAGNRVTSSDASALVIAQRVDMDLPALPRYGDAVFDNGQVAQAVAAQFGDLGDYEDIIPNRVSLVAEQDSIAFEVVGHDLDPQTAADIANTAATAFVAALNTGGVGVGTFAVQSPAEPPSEPGDGLGTVLTVPVGIVAGIALGLAVVSVILVARRPVIDGADVEEATGVRSLGTVIVPRTRRGRFARPTEFPGLVPVCRRLLGLPTSIVVLVSRPREQRVRRQLGVALASVLRRVRDVRFVGPSELEEMVAERSSAVTAPMPQPPRTAAGGASHLTVVDSNEPLDLVQPPQLTATVLVVREGVGAAALRAAVVEHLGGSAESGVLLVKRGRRSRGTATVGPPDDEEQPQPATVAAADTN